jgi:hypothetical protein
MLMKALEEITKKVIEKVLGAKHGWAVLALVLFVGGGYFLVKELRSSPDAAETLADPWFLTMVWFAASAVLCYVLWQLKLGRASRLAVLILIAGGCAAGWWKFVQLEPTTIRVDVFFDPISPLPTKETADFFATLQQAHIVVTMVTMAVPTLQPGERLDFEDVKASVFPTLRPSSVATHTVLITPRQLSGGGWHNLFYMTSPRFSAVSTYGILPSEEQARQKMLQKYLASMVPLAALHGQALEINRKLLGDRDPSTEHGCLHDFSVNKELLMEKLRRGPKMCAIESAEIAKVFGPGIASEYRAILAVAAAASAP